jgi:hypothetical protein
MINIKEILTETKTNKRTKKNKANEIIPSFKTRDENISQSSINDYISKYGYEKYKNITSDSGHETKKINYVMKNLHTVL